MEKDQKNSNTIKKQDIDVSTWPDADVNALDEENKKIFFQREKAVRLYIKGESKEEIKKITGIDINWIGRIINNRCLGLDEDGILWGWRALIPYKRIKDYTRTKDLNKNKAVGASGSMNWILESPSYIGLEKDFHKKILEKPSGVVGVRRTNFYLYKWFLNELLRRGANKDKDWPFTTENQGQVTIYKYIKRIASQNHLKSLRIYGGKEAIKKNKSGDGTNRPIFNLFERVECDAHKLDARMVVLIPSPHGGYETRKINRLWVIVILEVSTRAIIGYYLSMRKECSADDVLCAIKNSLTLNLKKDLSFTEFKYKKGACLPSAHSPNYIGACWNEFSVDGALANTCKKVEDKIKNVIGAKIISPLHEGSYSKRRSKDDRPFIESFFNTLAKGGFHHLSTTTGNNSDDKYGEDPASKAHEIDFQLEYAEELLDILISNYNVTPHSGLGYRTPLEQMDFLYALNPGGVRILDKKDYYKIESCRKICTLLGGEKTGRRPYFNFENARYSAEWLTVRGDLLGKKLWLSLHDITDVRWAMVSDLKGNFLGAVKAAPPWHAQPHTLFMRQSIRKLVKKRLIFLTSETDAIEELIRLAENNENSKMPAHPAYLQARKIIREYADGISENEFNLNKTNDERDNKYENFQESEDQSKDVDELSSLAIRRAKTW